VHYSQWRRIVKYLYKAFTRFQIFLYKRSGGKFGGKMMGFDVLLLTTIGRKSGKTYTTPLGYFKYKDGVIIVASNGGREKNPAWFLNIKENNKVKYQIINKEINGKAQILSGEEKETAWQLVVSEAPQYEKYKTNTMREIPVLLLQESK
jgi:F420H(2)-dependent quinone reductase